MLDKFIRPVISVKSFEYSKDNAPISFIFGESDVITGGYVENCPLYILAITFCNTLHICKFRKPSTRFRN